MAEVSDALNGFKTVLAAIDPSPQAAPQSIWVWPDDYASMRYDKFSFIIVEQVLNRAFPWTPVSHGLGQHVWLAGINILLASGPIKRTEAAQAAELSHEPWLKALAAVLFNNRSVNGAAIDIGNNAGLFTYRIGNLGWDKQIFWGLRAEVPVMQQHSLPMS